MAGPGLIGEAAELTARTRAGLARTVKLFDLAN
jgi:hypothetical protein